MYSRKPTPQSQKFHVQRRIESDPQWVSVLESCAFKGEQPFSGRGIERPLTEVYSKVLLSENNSDTRNTVEICLSPPAYSNFVKWYRMKL